MAPPRQLPLTTGYAPYTLRTKIADNKKRNITHALADALSVSIHRKRSVIQSLNPCAFEHNEQQKMKRYTKLQPTRFRQARSQNEASHTTASVCAVVAGRHRLKRGVRRNRIPLDKTRRYTSGHPAYGYRRINPPDCNTSAFRFVHIRYAAFGPSSGVRKPCSLNSPAGLRSCLR